jgi:hypothetical protein
MLSSQLELVEQAKVFLSGISAEDYQRIFKPHMSSSIGVHMRHILDHYLALQSGLSTGLVDYNQRQRGSEIESNAQRAMQSWQNIETWLIENCANDLEKPLQVISETSLLSTHSECVNSTLGRELLFVASHAIHHFSLMAISQSLLGEPCPNNFGVAPATASFQRQQAN